jgi:negative regulator of sigma E activity
VQADGTEEDEPGDDADPLVELFGPDEQDDRPAVVPSWLGAFGQMSGAALVVLAVVVAFIAAAVAIRRLWP